MKRLKSAKYRFLKILRAHQAFVVLVIVLGILLFAFLRVQTITNIPLDQAYIDDASLDIKTVKFNQQAIEQIKSLRDSNVVAPGTDLSENRQNPFSE